MQEVDLGLIRTNIGYMPLRMFLRLPEKEQQELRCDTTKPRRILLAAALAAGVILILASVYLPLLWMR